MRKKLSTNLPKLPYRIMSTTLTIFTFAFSCIFFKANGIRQAQLWIKQMTQINIDFTLFQNSPLAYLIPGIAVFIFIDHHVFKDGFDVWCKSKHIVLRWSIYLIFIFAIITISSVNTYPFIYSNF